MRIVRMGGDGAAEAREEGVPENGRVAKVRAVAALAHLLRARATATATATARLRA